ncbi:hypothetical protein ACFONL_07120 [Camelimonas fluminis]|uniref:Heat induced stress protein YflT n=1 Tax=Camelimonas fluminis TaxID=1576911 RepID=A0ABV7UEN1_9HYPH
MTTVSALFDTPAEATNAARRLESVGVPASDISVVSNNSENWYSDPDGNEVANDALTGAGLGAAVGGAGGLLAGLGLMAIPGVGPVVAAGWLAATAVGAAGGAATGAAAGGLVGAMVGDGVPEREANVYAEGVRRGGTLVSARVEPALVDRAQAVLRETQQVDLAAREAAYRETGWARFDPDAPNYTADQVRDERGRYL